MPFYTLRQVPVHSVLLLATRKEAISYPKGNITLGFCTTCGFISNIEFDPDVHEYSSQYEETQGYSATFNTFHRHLAQDLIKRYDLHDKDIIEIGCGKGEFLALLCELGNNRGVGFDPAFIPERNPSAANDHITFIKDFYSEKYTHYHGDFVVCKMTLEHIPNTAEFVSMVRRSIGNQPDTVVFFQVPDVARILDERAFWDIYYEHCSYFSLGSLARLFRRCGFDVTRLAKEYDDQYLMVEARPANEHLTPLLPEENDLATLKESVAAFAASYRRELEQWRQKLQTLYQRGRRTVIWGAGSKGVAFLTTLKIQNEIEFAVDINPYKHNHYLAGTGQKIVAPEFLKEYRPDAVVIMNPIYTTEIQHDLEILGITAELLPVGK